MDVKFEVEPLLSIRKDADITSGASQNNFTQKKVLQQENMEKRFFPQHREPGYSDCSRSRFAGLIYDTANTTSQHTRRSDYDN